MKANHKTIILLSIVALFTLAVGFKTNDKNIEYNATSIRSGVTSFDTDISGATLYRLNCSGCHGTDRKGIPPTFPSLLGVQSKLSRNDVRDQIANGKGQMPPMPHLKPDEVNAIVGYLFDDSVQQEVVGSLSPVELGEGIFKSNCTSCHRGTVNDQKPPNVRSMCSGMEPALLGCASKHFSAAQFKAVLDRGPCYMPSFSYLKEEDKEALYAYLQTLECNTQDMPMWRHRWRKGRWH